MDHRGFGGRRCFDRQVSIKICDAFCLWHFVSIVYLWIASHQLTQFKHLKNCPHWYQRSDAGTFVRLPWCQTKQSRLDCTPVNKHEPQKCSLEKGKHLQTIDF